MKGRTNDKHLDVIIIVLLFLIFMIVLITLTGSIYYFYRESDTLLASVIAFIGSIIGGSLTLFGVKWTLDSQRRNEIQQKYEKANYIFTELLPKMIDTYNEIKTINPSNWELTIDRVLEKSKILEGKSSEMAKISMHLDVDFYREVKNIEYYSIRIIELIENDILNPGRTDQQIYEDLLVFYNGIAKADTNLFDMVRQIKHS